MAVGDRPGKGGGSQRECTAGKVIDISSGDLIGTAGDVFKSVKGVAQHYAVISGYADSCYLIDTAVVTDDRLQDAQGGITAVRAGEVALWCTAGDSRYYVIGNGDLL